MSAIILAAGNLDPTGIASKIIGIISSIKDQYDQMKDNLDTCKDLNTQVEIVGKIVQDLAQRKLTDYCKQTLDELLNCLNSCSILINSITAKKKSFGDKCKAFLKADKNKQLIAALVSQLKDFERILNLALAVKTSNDVQSIIDSIRKIDKDNIPKVKKENKASQEAVKTFEREFQTINEGNVTAKGVGGNVTVLNAVTAEDEVIIAGGGHTYKNSEKGQNSVSPNTEERKNKTDKPNTLGILKDLRAFFRDGKLKGKQTPKFELYNAVLEPLKAALGYSEEDTTHKLYVNDDHLTPLGRDDAIIAIGAMINSLQSSIPNSNIEAPAEPSTGTRPAAAINRGNVNVDGQVGGDINSINVLKAKTVRIGENTHHHKIEQHFGPSARTELIAGDHSNNFVMPGGQINMEGGSITTGSQFTPALALSAQKERVRLIVANDVGNGHSSSPEVATGDDHKARPAGQVKSQSGKGSV